MSVIQVHEMKVKCICNELDTQSLYHIVDLNRKIPFAKVSTTECDCGTSSFWPVLWINVVNVPMLNKTEQFFWNKESRTTI